MSNIPGFQVKTARAREHFSQLLAATEQYFETDPFHVDIEEDDRGRTVYRLHVETPPPPRLSAVAGDILHNLRAGLDHLAYALVEANGGSPGRHTEFPIARNAADFSSLLNGRLKGASRRAKALTKRFKPYQGGTEGFWELHQLDIRDKHRLLITLVASNQAVVLDFAEGLRHAAREAGDMDPESIPDLPLGIVPADPCVRDGEPLFIGSEDDAPDSVEEFNMAVAIDEPGIVDCAQLDQALHRLGAFVEHVVGIYQRRCLP